MKRLVVAIGLLLILSVSAYAETVTTVAYNKQELQQAFSKWEFNMVKCAALFGPPWSRKGVFSEAVLCFMGLTKNP